ncbi:MAG: SOS response-associated peptidase [Pseudomonadota bacterium]
MCGRFTLTTPDFKTVVTSLGAEARAEDFPLYRPRFNIAPSDRHWILIDRESKRRLLPATWGFSDDSFINARIETAAIKPTFREAFRSRRCVIPADGFYEWTGAKGAKRPFWFHAPRGELTCFAGLFEERAGYRFTILTTAANAVVAPVHPRMPVIVSPRDYDRWIEAGEVVPSELNANLSARPVSQRVNSTRNDDPSCLAVDGIADTDKIADHQ